MDRALKSEGKAPPIIFDGRVLTVAEMERQVAYARRYPATYATV
jgi:hypothetical protein